MALRHPTFQAIHPSGILIDSSRTMIIGNNQQTAMGNSQQLQAIKDGFDFPLENRRHIVNRNNQATFHAQTSRL